MVGKQKISKADPRSSLGGEGGEGFPFCRTPQDDVCFLGRGRDCYFQNPRDDGFFVVVFLGLSLQKPPPPRCSEFILDDGAGDGSRGLDSRSPS